MNWSLLVIVSLATCEPQMAPVVFEKSAEPAGERLMLGEVAQLNSLPVTLRDRAATLDLMASPHPGSSRRVRRDLLVERARLRMPALARYLPTPDPAEYVTVAPAPIVADRTATKEKVCLTAVSQISAGAAPTEGDLEARPCAGAETAAAWFYDNYAGVVRAAADIPAGAAILAPPEYLMAGVRDGQSVSLRYQIGPVSIERDAYVVRAARAGAAIRVRTKDGALMTAPAVQEAP